MKPRIASLVNLLLALALAAVCTYWVLQFGSMRTPPEPLVTVVSNDRVPRTQPIDTAAVGGLFGAAVSAGQSRIRLTGIIAEGGKGVGVALLAIDGQPAVAYRAGEPIDGEMTLADVHSDRVVIRTAEGTRDVVMPERAPPAAGITSVR
jgi:general secretion pathway protein C